MKARLYRSRTDAMLAGVCGGLGDHFHIDSSLVRVVFVLLAIVPPCLGVLIYLALWLIVPREGEEAPPPTTVRAGAEEIAERARAMGEEVRTAVHRSSARAVLGVVLVAIGVIFLLVNLGLLWRRWIGIVWAIALVVVGLWLLVRTARRS